MAKLPTNKNKKKQNEGFRLQCHPLYLFLVATTLISVEIFLVYQRLQPSPLSQHGDDRPEESSSSSSSSQPQHLTTTTTTPQPSRRTRKPPDGSFNGYPIYYHDLKQQQEPMWSQMHCIGESFADPFYWPRKHRHLELNWMTRSCHFQFLCLDTASNDFVVFFPPSVPKPPTSHHYHSSTIFTNTSATEGMSIGGINAKWGHEGIPFLKWFPRVSHDPPTQFYTLPSNVTLIPFHSLAAFNPGHLVWDDFLPIFTVLQIFGLIKSTTTTTTSAIPTLTDLLLLRYILPGREGLWAGCDWRPDRQEECHQMLSKFGPLMIHHGPALPLTTQNSTRLHVSVANQSNYICARNALAGLGSLTDHGTTKLHGWEESDYKSVHNAGRGGQLWRFRNFMLNNLGLLRKNHHGDNHHGDDTTTTLIVNEPPSTPFLILFSEASSANPLRNMHFDVFVQALKELPNFDSLKIQIQQVQMKQYSLKEQAELVQRTAIYVTVSGGGAVSATFLPRGSSLIVFYSETGGASNNRPTGMPARLDWDYFNNMAYTRVNWLPKPKASGRQVSPEDLQIFVELILHEVDVMTRQRRDWENRQTNQGGRDKTKPRR